MIEGVHLVNEGAYDAEGTRLHGLKSLNFVFGPNGSGKTTISRVIDGAETYPDCTVTWIAGNARETRVYNRGFVKKPSMRTAASRAFTPLVKMSRWLRRSKP